MKEHEIEVEVSVPERDPILAIHDAEIAAELEEEVLEIAHLIAEKVTLENLVATLHEDGVLERMGLEDRLSDVTAEFASIQARRSRGAPSNPSWCSMAPRYAAARGSMQGSPAT